MIPFLDTSALVKRYVPEADSQRVRVLFRRGRPAVARIAYAELAATLARLWREGRLGEKALGSILGRMDDDFGAMNVLEIRAPLIRRVPDLVLRQPLRGYDAVQLAAALTMREHGAPVELWTADRRLADAARAEKLHATVLG